MAFGDSKIQQNVSVTPPQNAPTGAVTSGTADNAAIVVPVAVDEELLKLLGLTLEQYLQLSDEQKNEVNNQINQIKNSADETNFGIKGLSVEKTTTEAANDQLTSIENPVEVKAEVQNRETIQRDDIPKQTITEKDWKQMSARERALYLKAQMDNTVLKDVPDDKKNEAIKELVDQRIKQTRGFSDERWANMSDARKERLRERFMSDFSLIMENGFTKKDLESLSYDEKLHLEIESKEKRIQHLTEKLEEMSVNYAAGVDTEEYENKRNKISETLEKIKSDKDKTVGIDRLHEAFSSLKQTDISNQESQNVNSKDTIDTLSRLKGLQDTEADVASKIASAKDEQDVTMLNDAEKQLGRQFNFKNEKDIHLLAKMLNDEKLSPEIKMNEFIKIEIRLEEKRNSPDPKVRAIAEEQYTAYLEKMYDLGFDEKFIEEYIKTGKLSGENAERFNEFCGKYAEDLNKIAHPSEGHKKLAKSLSYGQAIIMDKGFKPDKRFDDLYKNEEYTDSVGDGLRQVKGSKAVGGYLKTMLPQLAASVQSSEFDKNMLSYAYTFEDDNDKIEFQKQLFDIVGDLAVENQSHAFETTMSSKFDEVQEYAASNIYKLDESVRDWASDYTKSLGKENLTDAIRTEPPAPEPKTSTNVSSDDDVTNYTGVVTNTIQNTKSEPQIKFEELSQNTKSSYNKIELDEGPVSHEKAVEYFRSLSRKEQSDLLNALPAQLFNKLPVTICENFPEYVPTFVDKGRGIEIITKCSSVVANSAMKSMKTGGTKAKKELYEFIAQHPERFNKISQEAAAEALGTDNKKNINNEPLRLNA